MEYTIWIKGQAVPVSEAVYHTYWQGVRKERYFVESDIHNHVYSYDALDTEGMNGCDMFCGQSSSVEEQMLHNLAYQDLMFTIEQLSETERDLIQRIYFYNESLRNIARQSRISPSTLQYRHQKILTKLKSLL